MRSIFPLALVLMSLFVGTAAASDDSDFFRQGAIVRKVEAASGDDGYRLISFGLYSYMDGGSIYHRIGIYDITDPADIYGVTFGLCDGPDRRMIELQPGGRPYVLTNVGCGQTTLQFGRPGREDQISTTRDELFAKRARFAVDKGQPISLGSSRFLVVYQLGADLRGFVFFPADVMDRLARFGAISGRPIFFVQTQEKDSNGQWANKSGSLAIGEVDGIRYGLRWNYGDQKWDIIDMP